MYVLFILTQMITLQTKANPWTEPISYSEDRSLKKWTGNTPGYWMGKKDEVHLKNIKTAKIKYITFNKGGSTISLRLHFTNNTDAAFKPDQHHEQTVPRYEIAAYRLNRMLGLSRVPPATWRTLTKKELMAKLKDVTWPERVRILREVNFTKDGLVHGEVSQWIPVIKNIPFETLEWRKKWLHWLAPWNQLEREQYIYASQLSDMILFDFITSNSDRFTGFNTQASPSGRRLYFMDNTLAFGKYEHGHPNVKLYLNLVRRFSLSLILKLKTLSVKSIKKELAAEKSAPWSILTDEEIGNVIKRRDYLMNYIVRTVAGFGWSKTVIFP
ncbi:hypothetical protein KKF34_00860 [Myxococcota bacterium]|nr:hypothetical protein [Myxococcota bacterium]MBU1381979.1 hypothetical protein [Myxococcota bacterium]MBU1495411.1 hypothetical protein [Myxococcota bacterium]